MQNNKKLTAAKAFDKFPCYWGEACNYLSARDPVMAKLIANYDGEGLIKQYSAFHTLARAIIGQQVSVAAADSIWAKFENLISEISPEAFSKAEAEELRTCGISRQKINYLSNIAEFFESNYKVITCLEGEDETRIAKELIAIKGVGSWTVEMFMIFHMHSKNMLPIKDIGLLKGFELNYDFSRKEPDFIEQLEAHAKKFWEPYCTVATWYLWRSIDPVAVEY